MLALARPRTRWLAELTRWSGSGSVGIDLIRCVSVDELRARLGSLQRFSALVVDEGVAGLDRDLLACAAEANCASIVVTSGIARRDWVSLGAGIMLDASFEREDLTSALRSIAAPVEPDELAESPTSGLIGPIGTTSLAAPLLAVTGAGGTGTSTVAIGLAQSLRGAALIDASLDSSLALMLGGVDVVPGLQELVEAHRAGIPSADDVRSVLSSCGRHGFDLLPGLRRHRDWTALRPRAVEATLCSLRQAYEVVVADIDSDLEGESDTGSFDIADRNSLARAVTSTADIVIVTGRPDLTGLSRLVSSVTALLDFGVPPERLLPIIMRPARCPLAAGEIRRSIATLLLEIRPSTSIAPVLVIEFPKDLDALLLDGAPLPTSFVEQLGRVLPAELREPRPRLHSEEPVAVIAGSLGIAS